MRTVWDHDKARLAVADLCERAAKVLREDREDTDAASIIECVAIMLEGNGVLLSDTYDCGLANANVGDGDREAAVAAISEGRHPPDSLPAFVEKMVHAYSLEDPGYRVDWVAALEWIGAKR